MKLTGIGLAVAVIAGLAVGSPAVAADSPAALQARKKAADSLVHARTAALGRATDAISASHSMGPDQAVVISAFNNAASGLQQLDAKIQADTTIAAVRADTAKIFSDYREVEGMKYPAHTVVMQNGERYIVSEVVSFKPLPKVDSREFTIPQ